MCNDANYCIFLKIRVPVFVNTSRIHNKFVNYAKLFCGNHYRYAYLFGNTNGIDTVLTALHEIDKMTGYMRGSR